MKSLSNPIMLVSDNPALPGGLSRMCRDLAMLCCKMTEFRVAVLGRGIGQNRRFPFLLYDFPEMGQWGEAHIKDAWEDFSGGEEGVIITLDDASRRHWFANPVGLPEDLSRFLGSGRNFKKWMYLPVDSTGPNGLTLSVASQDCVSKYDRVLAATEWGMNVLAYGGRKDADWLPHGFFKAQFSPVKAARELCDWPDYVVVGSVMANQSRKDFPTLFHAFSLLKKKYGNKFKGWLHTDRHIGYWNVYALAADYGVNDCVEVTMDLNDAQLAARYSACAATVMPTAGEGFGFPIIESQACGTKCVTTAYAGGSELVDENCRVQPVTYRVDTQHNVLRAVLSADAFYIAVVPIAEEKLNDWEGVTESVSCGVQHLEWNNLQRLWMRWLRGGLR